MPHPAATPKTPPLDQLQAMLNLVLEHTARVFVEANRGADKDRATATAAKLRAIVPGANNAFHEALDELEAQLITARWVLNRDLTTLREKQTASPQIANQKPAANAEPSKDIEMADATQDAAEEPPVAPTAEALPTPTDDFHSSLEDQALETVPDLSIDTSAKPSSQPDQPEPLTSTSAIDFDSLFNDTASADASKSPSTTPKPDDSAPTVPTSVTQPAIIPPPPPTAPLAVFPPSSNDDFSALLPGLESYANAAGNDSIDLSTPTPTTATQAKPTPTSAAQQPPTTVAEGDKPPESAAADKTDTTFDDLMNFADFDFGSFAVDGTGLDDGAGATFDESFFDVE